MAQFCLRIGPNPQACVTTTPRPLPIIRDLVKDPTTIVTTGTSYENRQNLSPKFFEKIIKRFEGTRLGKREILAQILEDAPGALWRLEQIDSLRRDAAPPLRRVVVAIDPSGGGGDEHDEVGIIGAGVDDAGHGWVLADASGSYSPRNWAERAIALYRALGADRIIAEVNYGGEMVEHTLYSVDRNIPFKAVHASRGKVARAEPISARYEKGEVHHCGAFAQLEDEMASMTTTGFVAGGSPNRVDALVWALTDLMGQQMSGYGIWEATRRHSEALGVLSARQGRALAPLGPNQVIDRIIRHA